MNIQLIIFDCDGVLVDTERIAGQVFSECLNGIGLSLSFDETVRTFKGRSNSDCLEIISNILGKKVPAAFMKEFDVKLMMRCEQELKPVPGIVDVLEVINYPVCVASSGDHEKLKKTLGKSGLLSRFEGKIFSASDVERGKPYPDLFLYVASAMSTLPSECVVVEDSVSGIKAAVSAGMCAVGYADLTDEEELRSVGARTFTDMRDLPSLLASLAA